MGGTLQQPSEADTIIGRASRMSLGLVLVLVGIAGSCIAYAHSVQVKLAQFGVTLELKLENLEGDVTDLGKDIQQVGISVAGRATEQQVRAIVAAEVTELERREDRYELRLGLLEQEVGSLKGKMEEQVQLLRDQIKESKGKD